MGIALLVAVLVHGKVVSGSRRWFDLGAFHLQPSELMKVLTIIALAKYIHDTPSLDGRTLRHILVPLFLAGLPILLVAAQPDLGTALIIGLISATVVVIARLRMKTLGGIIVAGVLAIAPLWEYALHDYQRNRVLAFINPALDPATAWQPRQAMNAVGSGRFIGKGFLQSTQIRLRSLPALWTDFPFAVWAEEWGFIGCVAVLIAYALLVLWVLDAPISHHDDRVCDQRADAAQAGLHAGGGPGSQGDPRGTYWRLSDLVHRGSAASAGRGGLEPAPEREKKRTWTRFMTSHWDTLCACDFFSVEALGITGTVRYMVFFVIEIKSRAVDIAGIAVDPGEEWMKQVARNLTDPVNGFLRRAEHLIHDRDPLFSKAFIAILKAGGVKSVKIPAQSPNCNPYAERFVRTIKYECLNQFVIFGERHLRHLIKEFVEHYMTERFHQGIGGQLIRNVGPTNDNGADGKVACRSRFGGLLNFYYREAA